MDENFYFSLDRLVEFGLGTAVATQMISSMNQSINAMTIPGVNGSMKPAIEPIYYVALNNESQGPFSRFELMRMISEGKVTKETLVWQPGEPGWKAVESVEEILKLVALAPPAIPN